MSGLSDLWNRALSPDKGFHLLAEEEVRLMPSLGWLMALRVPVAFLELLLTYWGFGRMYQAILSVKGPVWDVVLPQLSLGMNAEDVRYLLQDLPPMPPLAHMLPWVLLAAPLYVISLWLHDAVWDHGCLWMLGGLKAKRGFNMTLIAEAEALQVGVFGAILALLTGLPGVGWVLTLPIGLAGAYFWILRGFALAAFHRCATWKGVLATVIHAALAACILIVTLGLLFVLVFQAIT
jgi:hypothetical protein